MTSLREHLAEQLSRAEACLDTDAVHSGTLAAAALEQARPLGAPELLARALCTAAAAALFQNSFRAALPQYQEALSLARGLQHPALTCRALNGLGLCHLKLAEYDDALTHFLEGLRLLAPDDSFGRLRLLNNVGVVHMELGDHELALETHLQVLALAEELGEAAALLSAVVNLIVDRFELGEYERVLALIERHHASAREQDLHHHALVLAIYRLLCEVQLDRVPDPETVERELHPLLVRAERAGDWDNLVHALTTLGAVQLRGGSPERAAEHLRRALELAHSFGLRARARDALLLLSEVHRRQEAWREAYEAHLAYHALERALHAEEVDRRARRATGEVQLERLRWEAALERRRAAELLQAHSELLRDRDEMARRASHDSLTGLANRATFQAQGEALLAAADSCVAVVYLDLDGFKPVNDRFGHAAGDELLAQVAWRLRTKVGRRDVVARLGGDEFALLLTDGERAEETARRLLEAFSAPFVVDGVTVRVGASIGLALYPDDARDLATLQRQADAALYAAKRGGRNTLCRSGAACNTP